MFQRKIRTPAFFKKIMNPFSLAGKTVLVTGASSGIGRAAAIECSEFGARLVVTGRNPERLQETFSRLSGEGHKRIIAELTDSADVNRLVEECPELNGLVLCAGIGMTLPFQFCTRDKIDPVFETNFFAPVELMRTLTRKKRIAKSSSVVIVASIGGVMKFSAGNSIYGASKAALDSFVKFTALELASKSIRVNAVNPGMTNTPLIDRGTLTAEQFAADALKYPLKRYGEPEDVAHGIVYLLSDASSWVTGHSLVIDGGISI